MRAWAMKAMISSIQLVCLMACITDGWEEKGLTWAIAKAQKQA